MDMIFPSIYKIIYFPVPTTKAKIVGNKQHKTVDFFINRLSLRGVRNRRISAVKRVFPYIPPMRSLVW